MPPRIRTRASKALKENSVISDNKLKDKSKNNHNNKVTRKALADKTNSASDDTSLEIPKSKGTNINKNSKVGQQFNIENIENASLEKNHGVKKTVKPKQRNELKNINVLLDNGSRPRRDRRLPSRFVENPVLTSLSNSKEGLSSNHVTPVTSKSNSTPVSNSHNQVNKTSLSKSSDSEPSPFKTPSKIDSSLLKNRPRRICRLPSRLEDHSISPNKYIPIQPAHASTPIQQAKTKPVISKGNVSTKERSAGVCKELSLKPLVRLTRLTKKDAVQKDASDKSSVKSSPDSNNNPKGRSAKSKISKPVKNQQVKKKVSPTKVLSSAKVKSPVKNTAHTVKKVQTLISQYQSPIIKRKSPVKALSPKLAKKRLIDKNLSFKVLEGKKKPKSDESNLDVYEFTFDPNEEPKPQKKKKKKTVRKKNPDAKPKKVYKSVYDKNISKALAALKNAVNPAPTKLPQITEVSDEVVAHVENIPNANIVSAQIHKELTSMNDTGKNSVHECNYPSIRVEDIAADIEPSIEHHDDINYSPVNSPRQTSLSPHMSLNVKAAPKQAVPNNDPLNLQDDLSFFDDQPVASSSMNMSVRHPLASPWRVEFGSLPIKWPVNTYVKPNMTPAVESSFISSEETNKKKHVYTNIIPDAIDALNEMVNNTSNLKQTSIISFIKERAEMSAKKKRGRSVSPTKAMFEDIVDINAELNHPEAHQDHPVVANTSEDISNNDTSTDKENSKGERKTRKRKNNASISSRPAKSPRKKDNNCTYFGFDDSENQNNENLSPIKVNNKVNKGRSLRLRQKVLQEINGPSRAVLPVSAKSKITSSEAVNKVYEELKSAADAPLFPEKAGNNERTNVNETNIEGPSMNEDSQSVHLFEDIEVVHHLKPTRKSYGKAKKVTFQHSVSDSDSDDVVVPIQNQNDSSDYDDLGDLTFEMPNVKEKKVMKKKKPKKLRSKKEEQEAEAWAANFNSMCEDIEEFPLLLE